MTPDDRRTPSQTSPPTPSSPTRSISITSPNCSGKIERLRAIPWARLALRINRTDPKEDRLLSIGEAAARLDASKDWLYRNGGRLPFTVRLSDRALRFSAKGIDRWIASRVRYGCR